MTAGFAMNHRHAGCCGSSAAACTSASICTLLDTALLAVSIIIVRLVLVLGLQLR